MEEQHKPHRAPHGARNEKGAKDSLKGKNPKAFAIQSVNKARKKFAHALDKFVVVHVG